MYGQPCKKVYGTYKTRNWSVIRNIRFLARFVNWRNVHNVHMSRSPPYINQLLNIVAKSCANTNRQLGISNIVLLIQQRKRCVSLLILMLWFSMLRSYLRLCLSVAFLVLFFQDINQRHCKNKSHSQIHNLCASHHRSIP